MRSSRQDKQATFFPAFKGGSMLIASICFWLSGAALADSEHGINFNRSAANFYLHDFCEGRNPSDSCALAVSADGFYGIANGPILVGVKRRRFRFVGASRVNLRPVPSLMRTAGPRLSLTYQPMAMIPIHPKTVILMRS